MTDRRIKPGDLITADFLNAIAGSTKAGAAEGQNIVSDSGGTASAPSPRSIVKLAEAVEDFIDELEGEVVKYSKGRVKLLFEDLELSNSEEDFDVYNVFRYGEEEDSDIAVIEAGDRFYIFFNEYTRQWEVLSLPSTTATGGGGDSGVGGGTCCTACFDRGAYGDGEYPTKYNVNGTGLGTVVVVYIEDGLYESDWI